MRILGLAVGLVACAWAHGQLVVGNDADSNMWLIDVEGISPARAIVRGTSALSGAIAWDPMGTLYWVNGQQTLMKAANNPAGEMTAVVVANLTVGGAAAANFAGLAFDSVERKLFAYRNNGALGTEGFYEVNATTAACTLVWPAQNTSLDFGAFDYDRGAGEFYGVNDSVVALPGGRGLYALGRALGSPTLQLVVSSPNSDGDIDGLAIGDGRAYLVNDNVTQGVYVFDLSSQVFVGTIALPYTVNGTFAGAAWAPEVVAANVGVELLVPPSCGIGAGAEFEFSVLVRNVGPDAAKDARVEVELPASAGFVSSEPTATPEMGVLRLGLGHVQANGTALVRVRLVAPGSGVMTFRASASTRTNDPVGTNNVVMVERTVGGTSSSPASRSVRVVMSTVAGSVSSVIADPALGGARFVSNASASVGRVYVSPSGAHAAFLARTTAGTEFSNDGMFSLDQAGVIRLIAREGVTRVTETIALRGVGSAMPIQPAIGVGDDGSVVFAGVDASELGFAAAWQGGVFSVLARQNASVGALGAGVTFARGTFACQVDGMGRRVLLARLAGTGVDGTNDTIVLRDGSEVLTRSGFTVPFDQEGGTQATVRAIPHAGSDALQVVGVDASGARMLYRGLLALADAGKDEVLVVDNAVVVQEGVVLAGSGFGSPVRGSVATARFGGDGSWLAMGSNQDESAVGSHWVVREGRVMARRGEAISACASERWARGATDGPFVAVAGNARGDVAIAGYTDEADAVRAMVLVLNGSWVVARAGDALDLDSNGLFDDGAFIEQFKVDHLELGDRVATVGVTVSSPSTADCGATRVRVGEAILRVALPCAADVDDGTFTGTRDEGVTVDDLVYYLDIFAQGLPGADVDDGSQTGRLDCGVTVDDLLFYVVRFEAGC